MFDVQQAFAALNGRSLTHEQLLKQLEEIRVAAVGELPPDCGVRELFFLARKEGWLTEYNDGMFIVSV